MKNIQEIEERFETCESISREEYDSLGLIEQKQRLYMQSWWERHRPFCITLAIMIFVFVFLMYLKFKLLGLFGGL